MLACSNAVAGERYTGPGSARYGVTGWVRSNIALVFSFSCSSWVSVLVAFSMIGYVIRYRFKFRIFYANG